MEKYHIFTTSSLAERDRLIKESCANHAVASNNYPNEKYIHRDSILSAPSPEAPNGFELPGEKEVEIRFPCEVGQEVIMEEGKTYIETLRANYFRRQGFNACLDLIRGNSNK